MQQQQFTFNNLLYIWVTLVRKEVVTDELLTLCFAQYRHDKVMVPREVIIINTSSFGEVNKRQTTNRLVTSNTSL